MRSTPVNRRCWAPVACLIVAFAFASGASAQILAPEIMTSDKPLTSTQNNAVDAYVKYWAERLLAPDQPATMGEARQRLRQPAHEATSTQGFKQSYFPRVSAALKPGLENKNAAIRLNTLIVLEQIHHNSVAGLGVKALNDTDPSVQYWAIKTLRSYVTAAGNTALNARQQKQLVNKLVGTLSSSQSSDMVLAGYQLLDKLTDTKAHTGMLDIIDKRVAMHVDGEGKAAMHDSIRADIVGIRLMVRRLVQQRLKTAKPVAWNKQLTAAMAKYLRIATETMATRAAELRDIAPTLREDLIALCEKRFVAEAKEANAAFSGGPSFKSQADKGNWAEAYLSVLDWVGQGGQPGHLTKQLRIPANMLQIGNAPATPKKPTKTAPGLPPA